MADLLKNVLGGGSKGDAPLAKPDSDFADFASAPEPVPEAGGAAAAAAAGSAAQPTGLPSKWYNVHERHSISEFKTEGIILVIMAVVMFVHIVGARANRTKAKKWMKAHAPTLTSQYALVGFSGVPNSQDEAATIESDSLIKEKSLHEFATYATGRQNVAFTDARITLTKKFNPFMNVIEMALGYFSTMFTIPTDTVDVVTYPFDGREGLTVPRGPGSEEPRKDGKSTYDDFIWAVVNKDCMQSLREDRYDASLTVTKDSPKLPNWLSVMSESAEITDTLLTPELIEAVTSAGDLFDYLIISDQPIDKPKTLKETQSRKTMSLKYRLPASNTYDNLLPIFSYFVRLPDTLVQAAHFRPEVTRKVSKVRDGMSAQLRKAAEEEAAEERLLEREKAKKAKREADLSVLDAKAQKKYLEKEKEKEFRRSQKKSTMRG